MRYDQEIGAEIAAHVSQVPILNAGDRHPGQHPTQALLDLYTIQRELKRIDRINIAFVGDLKNGRTVRSLVYLLGKYKSVKVHFISPPQLAIGSDIKEYLKRHGVLFKEVKSWDSVLSSVDVFYQTRIQKERFKSAREYGKFKGKYILTMREVDKMKRGAIVMHPLPRVDEIEPEVDASSKAVYFKQARYGVLVRMALLALIFR